MVQHKEASAYTTLWHVHVVYNKAGIQNVLTGDLEIHCTYIFTS